MGVCEPAALPSNVIGIVHGGEETSPQKSETALDRFTDLSMDLSILASDRRTACIGLSVRLEKTPVSSKKRMDSGCTLRAREQTTSSPQPSNYTAAEFRRFGEVG